MNDQTNPRLTEEEAARLWQRAARMQAEALERSEADATSEANDDVMGGDQAEAGYALVHVREAAIEAGIGPEYLDSAIVDLRAEQAARGDHPSSRLAKRVLDDPPEVLTVRRVIAAPPEQVLSAMGRVFVRDAYQLTLTDRRGDPLEGGILVFKIEGASLVATEGFKGQASAADLREVLVTLQSTDPSASETDVTIRGPIAWAHRMNAAAGVVMSGVSGAVGLGVGWASSAALVGVLAATIPLAAPVAAGLAAAYTAGMSAAGGAIGLSGLRTVYNYQVNKGREGLETLLSLVAVEAEGGWRLNPVEPPGDVGGGTLPATQEGTPEST